MPTAELEVMSGPLRGLGFPDRGLPVHIVSITGEEAVSELFAFEVVLLAPPAAVLRAEGEGGVEAALLQCDVRFRLGPEGDQRAGMIHEVRAEGPFVFDDGTFARWRLRVAPRAWLLTQRRNSRIFQQLYVDEIVSTILSETGVRHRWDLQNRYPRRIYCTQYEETDYDFVRRLFAEEGIFFHFEFVSQETDADEGDHHPRPRPDDVEEGFRKAFRVIGGAAKELSNIGDKTDTEVLGGVADMGVGAAGMTGDLFRELEDEENDEPQVLGSHRGGPTGFGEVLVFTDTPQGWCTSTADDDDGSGELELELIGGAGLRRDRQHIESLVPAWRVAPDQVEVRDFDFRRPLLLLKARAGGELDDAHQPGRPLEMYDHHGEYTTEDVDGDGAALRLEQHRRDAAMARGRGECARIAAGHRFRLRLNASADTGLHEGEQAVTRVRHEYFNTVFSAAPASDVIDGVIRGCARAIREAVAGGLDQPEEEIRKIIRSAVGSPDAPPREYQNRFECVDAALAFRPPRPARALRHVTETATVMGPPGQDIFTDRHGRVKVQFHWDRQGRFDAKTSCWLRVAQPWAGAGFGFQFFPRVGMEVLVTFIGGDTDRPVVVGALYNGTHATPELLPERRTRSGIRTQTSPHGGGFNELSFEDAKNAERVYVHAERNFEAEVNHDHDLSVGHRMRTSVGGDAERGIAGSERTTVGGDRSTMVGGDSSAFVQGSSSTRVVANRSAVVDGSDLQRIAGMGVRSVDASDLTVVGGAYSVAAKTSHTLHVAGSATTPVASTTYVRGGSYLTATQRIVLIVPEGEDCAMIRLQCGDSVIEMRPDRISIEAEDVSIRARNQLDLVSKDASIQMRKSLYGSVKEETLRFWAGEQKAGIALRGSGEAILHGDQTEVRGQQVTFNDPGPADAPQVRGPSDQTDNPRNVTLRFTHLASEHGDPIANTRYYATLGAWVFEGQTDGDGQIQIYVVPGAATVDVMLFAQVTYPDIYPTGPLRWSIGVFPDSLPEASTPQGAASRLLNLGYQAVGEIQTGDEVAPNLADGLRDFQFDNGLSETGELDDDTVQKLRDVYGA